MPDIKRSVSAILFLRNAGFSDLFKLRGIGYKGMSKRCHKKRPAQRPAEFREEAQCCAALCYPPETTIMCQVEGYLLFGGAYLTVSARSWIVVIRDIPSFGVPYKWGNKK